DLLRPVLGAHGPWDVDAGVLRPRVRCLRRARHGALHVLRVHLGAGRVAGRGLRRRAGGPDRREARDDAGDDPVGRAPLRGTGARAPRRGVARTLATQRCQGAERRSRRRPRRVRRTDPATRAVRGMTLGSPMTVWIVDAMNVIGSRPTGWWRDRPAAVRRLLGETRRLVAVTREPVTLVVDGRPPPHLRSRPGLGLEGHDVLRGRALCALDHVELDLGALRKAPMAFGLDGAVMAEDVLLAVVTRDEAEALLVVEPLDRSCRTHRLLLLVFE